MSVYLLSAHSMTRSPRTPHAVCSCVPKPSHCPVFDCLQHTITEDWMMGRIGKDDSILHIGIVAINSKGLGTALVWPINANLTIT